MFQTISVRQLEELLDSGGEFTLLDVRSRDEFENCHLEGALNVPLAELENHLDRIPRERPVVVYCACGSRSLIAARRLEQLGRRTAAVCGGLCYYRGKHLKGRKKSFDRRPQTP